MNVYIGEPILVSDMQGPCPDGFHVPLQSEWQAICNAYTGLGLSGGDNFATYLKMPKAGSRPYYDVSPFAVGSTGYYWSSSNYNNNYNNAWALLVYSHNTYPLTDEKEKGNGCSIRGLKNTPVTPTSSRTVLYQGTGSAGIYWNSIDGLISISADETTWYTLMDKNLGATTVYNYGDTLTDANCGNVFQWGNNYAFPGTLSSASITTSGTQVNASTYGPGNYYSSNKFIIGNNDWDSSLSANLRGGVSQGTSTKSTEVQNIYIGEYVKPREPDSNTIVYWKLDGDAKDSSGNNRDGTVSGTLTYESIGSIDVAKFTGSQQVYRTGSEFALGNNHAFTFSVWVKPTSTSSPASLACIQRENNSGTWDKELYVNNGGSFYGYFYTGTPNYVQDTTAGEITTSSWNYITYTFDGSTLKLYLNGTLKNTSTPTLGSYTIVSPQLILSRPTYNYGYRYSGYMSNFILQDNAWDASYISNYFNTYKGLYGLS